MCLCIPLLTHLVCVCACLYVCESKPSARLGGRFAVQKEDRKGCEKPSYKEKNHKSEVSVDYKSEGGKVIR